jgi:outer membrane murein-binding lipoprotein Lpp
MNRNELMNMKTATMVASMLASCLVAGCATQTRTEMEFGDAVRTVTSNQVHDKAAGTAPTDAVAGGDPYRLEAVVTSHRGDVSKPQQVSTPVEAGVGSRSRQR